MKLTSQIPILLTLALLACNTPAQHPSASAPEQTQPATKPAVDTAIEPKPKPDTIAKAKSYSNEAFKGVTVRQTAANTFEVAGKARVFEAAFSWVIEDGHQELTSGHEMTDAGAPAWGNFRFRVAPLKARANSTLTLILFESSAKDGSRMHELVIPLPG